MITELTLEQDRLLDNYYEEGVKIGLATSTKPLNEDKIRKITDKHRVMCGMEKATNFLVFDSPIAAMEEIPTLTKSNALYGQGDIYWLQHYKFFKDQFPEVFVEGTDSGLEAISYLYKLAKKTSWMWMSTDTTIVTRRPTKLRFAENGTTLHSLIHPSVEFADGKGWYFFKGTQVEKQYEKFITEELPPLADVLLIQTKALRDALIQRVKQEGV